MTLKRYLFVAMAWAVLSCDSDESGSGRLRDCYILSETENQILRSTFEYENRKLMRISAFNEIEALLAYSEYSYDSAGFPVSIRTYTPQDDLLSERKITYYQDSTRSDFFVIGSLVSYEMYYYNESECPLESVAAFDGRGNRGEYFIASYDDSCSPTLDYYDESGNLTRRIVQLSDQMKSAFRFATLPFFGSLTEHNLIAQTIYDSLGSIFEPQSYTSTFEYNSHGYPTEENRIYSDGRVAWRTFDYDCKKQVSD